MIGSGTLMAVAPGQGILAHRNADGGIHTYVAVNRLEAWPMHDVATATDQVVAMFDGAELARALRHRPGDREDALAAYERDLFARSGPVARLSVANLERFFGPDAPTSVVELFASR